MLSRLFVSRRLHQAPKRCMSKMIGIVTEKPFSASAVDAITSVFSGTGYTVKRFEGDFDHREAVKGMDAIIVRSDKITDEVMKSAGGSLSLIVRAGAGVDSIDLDAATGRNIVVQNTPGQNANAVAELVIGMMITSARNNYDGTSGFELRGKTLALYGYGAIAQQVHRLATGFGMDVWAFDPFVDAASMQSAGVKVIQDPSDLFDAHFVSLHCPLTNSTRASIGTQVVGRMPKKGVLINTARKEIIDEAGLVDVLTRRRDLSYFGDVTLDKVHAAKLADNSKVHFTAKKMGAQTAEANTNAGTAAAAQIIEFFESGINRFQVNKK
jgi:D-3-phosphoglycerate dehydrogenase / 2-oxoglutarate reductase